MTHLLAEGGYQIFVFSSSERIWLSLAIVAALASLGTGLLLMRNVLAADQGTASMKDIAKAVQEGAEAFLARQFKTILIIIVPLAVLIFFTATKVTHVGYVAVTIRTPVGLLHAHVRQTITDLTFVQAGIYRVVCFLAGALCSGLTGFVGMSLAVRGNVRTAAAARGGKLPPALRVAFRTGAITGLFCVGLGLLGATIIVFIFQNTATAVLIGFGFGASLLALFMRVGGGIFTKAADVGADLVGKVEAGIPEDDPRNAATIADNVGDNVGDCAGMAADLFESYVITIIASIILGVTAFASIGRGADAAKTVVFPIAIPAIGIIATIVGIFVVRAYPRDKNAMAPINRGVWTAAAITIAGSAVVAGAYLHYWKAFYAVLVGVALTVVLSLLTEHFTSTERSPVREVAESARTGPATLTLAGISLGLESAVWALLAIVLAISASIGLAGGNIELSLYLVSLTGIGLLSTAGMIVSEDSFGPVSDNAAGVAEMSGEFTGEAERVMVSLDAVGNTTKAVTKGVAIGSAVIAAVALFASFIETIGTQLNLHAPVGAGVNWLFDAAQTSINVSHPTTFIGVLIGGSIAFIFSALAIRAVGRSAGTVVQEVRRQFREHPGIMDYTEKPEYGKVISICTTAAQRELATPALLAVLSPVIVGFGINYFALAAFLVGAILTSQLMAVFLSNSGGAWDNAKKYIEDGHEGGKGSDAHKAAVIGDTIGDPFKDTAGPALNPLMKVMNLVSLLVLPTVITLRHNTPARLIIAAVALVVLAAAIAFSKRKTEAMDSDLPPSDLPASEEAALEQAAEAATPAPAAPA
jgi:K(+)-stimulated pyrophosphate-energized sodium pump